MAACAQVADYEKGLGLLQKMQEYNVTPTVAIYNALLNCCAPVRFSISYSLRLTYSTNSLSLTPLNFMHVQRGEVERGYEVLNMMRAAGVEPDHTSYSILIKAYKACGDERGAILVLELMHRNGVPPQPIAFIALIKSLEDVEKGVEVWDMLKRYQCKPDEILYRVMIDLCVRKGDHSRAFQYYQQMVSEGIKPSCRVFNMLIGA